MPQPTIQKWQKPQMIMYYNEGLSINAISKKVGLSHPTVDKFIEECLGKKHRPENRKNRKSEERRKLLNKYFKPTKDIVTCHTS